MASFKCFVPLMLCVLLVALCSTTSAKPLTKESEKGATTLPPDAEDSFEEALAELDLLVKHEFEELIVGQLGEIEAGADKLDKLLDELTTTPKPDGKVEPNTERIAEDVEQSTTLKST